MPILTERQAAAQTGLSIRTLQRERVEGRLGLPFIRLGLRRIGYDSEAITRWLAARQYRTVAEERGRSRAATEALPP